MIGAVWTVSIILAAFAATDKRAHPLLGVVVLGTVQMVFAEIMLADRLADVAMKIPIDLSCGFLAAHLVTRERWTLMVPALFSVSLLAHGAYWLARFNGFDIWVIYAHTLNALFLGQLVALCWPSGGRLIGILASWARNFFGFRGGIFSPVYEKAIAARSNKTSYVGSCRDLHFPSRKRI